MQLDKSIYILHQTNKQTKKSCLWEVSKMHSEPLLPPENNLPEEECYVAGATHLQLSWCREALGQIVPHASDELVAPPLCQPVAPGCCRTRPHFPPSSLCLAVCTSAGSESRRAGVGVKGSEHSGRLPASLPSASQVGQVITASAALRSR